MQAERLIIRGTNFGPPAEVDGRATESTRTIAGDEYPRADFELWNNHPDAAIRTELRRLARLLGNADRNFGEYRRLSS